MSDYNDLIQTAIDGVLSEEDALQFIIENGGDEELLRDLGYNNVINSSIKTANIIDKVINKCKNNKALLAGVIALLITSGQLFGYEVVKGDNLWQIAKDSNCEIEDIYRLNPELKKEKYIYPGMNIVLPNEINKTDIKVYKVQKGDTISEIAEMFDMSINELKSLNPQIKDINKINIDDEINVNKKDIKKDNKKDNNTLNLDAVLKALRQVESTNGANTIGDGGNAIGDYQLWEIFVEDYHRLGGNKNYKCHVIDGVAQPDDVRWDRKKCEEMIKHVFKKYGYKTMQQVLRGFGKGKGARPGWNKGVSDKKLKEYVDAYNKYNK